MLLSEKDNYSINERICVLLYVFAAYAQAHVVFIDRYSFINLILYPVLLIYSIFNLRLFSRVHLHSSLLFFIALLYMQLRASFIPIHFWVYPSVIMLFLLLSHRLKLKVFDVFISSLTIILIIGLIFWSLSILSANVFLLGHTFIGDRFYYIYPFYVVEYNPLQLFAFNRFSSVFDEPGMLGTISSLILCAKKFNLLNDYRLFVILIGGIFSMSLAFYLICFLYLLISAKFSLRSFIPFVFFILIFVVLDYCVGGVLWERFSFRLDVDNVAELDNRSSMLFNSLYNSFLNSSEVYFGMGHNAHLGIGGTDGIRVFIYNYGYMGIVLLFIAYISIIYSYKIRIREFAFIIVYALSFYQRAGIYRLYMLLPFIVGLILINQNCNEKSN